MKKLYVILGVYAAIMCNCVTIGVPLSLEYSKTTGFKNKFIARCETFSGKDKGNYCENIWSVFEGAYIGKDPCKVPMEAYDLLIKEAPIEPAYNRMMFWSKTEDVFQQFAKKKNLDTLEDTLLGSVVGGHDNTWCGKEGSRETFTTGCPEQSDKTCLNNPVRSFWDRASAAFADVASGRVTVLLNGGITTPFNRTSTFAKIEVKRFTSKKVKSLNVFLINQKKDGTNCDNNQSLRDLKGIIEKKGIAYSCNRGDRVWLSHVLLLSFLSISTS